ncbi:NADH-quinone oxidoreductase subunit J [Orbaceae bacterium ESL0727]|nr:NADH-quinone oxidoreductase subunit J [Orbaceae bacterium ESL0727]
MVVVFYIASVIAVFASIKVISCSRIDKTILYFVLLLLATALICILLNAYFSTILSIILFIGGIAILFLYVASFLKITVDNVENGRRGISPKVWLGPLILAFILLVLLIYGIVDTDYEQIADPHKLLSEMSLDAYILMSELAGFLLLGTVIIAYHFMRRLFTEMTG